MSILLIGDIMLDANYFGTSNRLAPEAPVPVVKVNKTEYLLGGCGNVFNNLVAFSIDTKLITIIGADNNGKRLKELLESRHLDTTMIITDGARPTTIKNRIFVNDKLISRYDIENSDDVSGQIIDQVKSYVNTTIDTIDIVILSDYTKGLLTYELTQYIINLANSKNKLIFVDPKDKNFNKYNGCTLIKPNRLEAELILHDKIAMDNLQISTNNICNKVNAKFCLLTLGENGLVIFDQNKFEYITSNNKKVIDVTGAGDMVLASFTYYYLKTKNLFTSAHFANYCGQVKVAHVGTYTINAMDILNYKRKFIKLIADHELSDIINTLKNNGNKIVFTNGCFDIIHYGHMTCLENAKKYGDILIVGLNSDETITKSKGSNRPYNCLKYRIKQLEMLSVVDFVIVFNEDTPLELIKRIKPDFLVKGGDYKLVDVVGQEHAKQTIVLTDEYTPVTSTKLLSAMRT